MRSGHSKVGSLFDGADGGGRTHTLFRVPDFESSASANSATSALPSDAYNPHRSEFGFVSRPCVRKHGKRATQQLQGRWLLCRKGVAAQYESKAIFNGRPVLDLIQTDVHPLSDLRFMIFGFQLETCSLTPESRTLHGNT